jgi:hypothetical protein
MWVNWSSDSPVVRSGHRMRAILRRAHDAVIRVYDQAARKVIETHEHSGDFKERRRASKSRAITERESKMIAPSVVNRSWVLDSKLDYRNI